MKILVLGSSAGGGFPQWNCNCRNCHGVRHGTVRARPRTQSSIAVSSNGDDWVLFNASPDLLAQIRANPCLQPARALRDSGIAGVVLIDAQVDHTTGLFMLREGQPLPVWCTAQVHEDLTTGNPVFNVLSHFCTVVWHPLQVAPPTPFTVPGVAGLRFTPVPLASKAPPYSPHRDDPHPGDNIGVLIEDATSGRKVFYAPGFGAMAPHLEPYLAGSDGVLLDGTFWSDDEMIRLGISTRTAREIGHLPQSGAGGMIELLARYPRPRKILIHINNTNPILDEDSRERAELARHGIEVAADGMLLDFGPAGDLQ
ncbi:pyrroloquinoline quinone biosynthesis protein PqqB [Aromatoleum bremense]|uniref:Coenzyme PQQ synthesis protein B n=1 Tax=Aromatoleum bremense TaxID=76115 RepID=A0ABX1NY61_9RHOO|nr:pyrroloquinoline quinone biosynthesis protein PqqB [Aromatoleum bremense]NMG16475.1 pyrroloquinoline quinone biosynthesis protein PqqB [Aromatoleum bremense]QTQ31244.1 Coenzyme PQQ biosynthesis protein [Aromatoleum bremense]